MLAYIWPIALLVISNIVYHVCAKSIPNYVSPFAALTVSYLIGALISVILLFVTTKGHNPIKDILHLNWASYVLGLVVIGLEVGSIYAYKAGWQISTASIVQSAFVTIALLLIGFLFYSEGLQWNKVIGVVICLVGLIFINCK